MKLIFKGNPFSVNATYKRGKGKSFYTSELAKDYGDNVALEANIQWKGEPLEGLLEVLILYFFENNRSDHLNCNKILLDKMQGIVYKNDKQVKVSHHYHLLDKEDPRIEIHLKEIENVLDLYKNSPFYMT